MYPGCCILFDLRRLRTGADRNRIPWMRTGRGICIVCVQNLT